MTETNLEQWKQANKIYAQLMDLTVSAALDQLNQMVGLNDELKSMVLSLISSGNLPSQLFKQQVGSHFELEGGQTVEYKTGDLIDGYELLDPLGSGGMAVVYKAKKVDVDSHKPVAIKVFNRSDFSPLLRNRFSIEQDILSGLSHPNIVNMHHGGTSEQGVSYIVMDLIEDAKDIDDYAKQNQASVRQIVAWVLSAAKAIAYAHNNLIVHRDIKPSNLLIDASGRLQVVDFGIAKLMTRDDAPQKTTIMALTPSFAAPEQINSGQISVSTDVFSLAAVCLSLLIEELPLPADRLLKSCTGDEAHIWQVLRTKIKDKDLRNILNQAMQQDPQKRYQNMGLLVDDLTAWLAYKPVLATPDSWMYRIRKFAKRRSALFAALSTLLVMILLGIVLMGWQVEKTRAEASKATAVKDFMLGVFSVVNPDDALGEKILAKDLLSQASAEIKSQDFNDSAIKVELLTAIGQAQFQLGLRHPAADSFKQALSIDKQASSASLGVIRTQVLAGDYVAAKNNLESLEKSIDEDFSLQADLLLIQSTISVHEGNHELAEDQVQQARHLYNEQEHIKGYLDTGRQLANIMYFKSESKAAAELLEQQLAFGLQQLAPTNTVILAIKNDLVELYNDVGDYDRASKHSEKLIEDVKVVLGEQHPFLIQAYISQAGTQRATGEIDAAKVSANNALKLSTAVNGEQHGSTARAINFIAVLHYVDGEIDLALLNMQKAADIFEQILGDDHPETWDVKTNLTALLNVAGRYEEAIATVEPVFSKQSDVLGAGHKSTIYSQTVLARLYGDVGRLDEAEALGEDMVNKAVAALGLDHPLTAGGYFSLAGIYKKTGKYAEAIALIDQIISHDNWDKNNERAISAYNTLADLYLAIDDTLSAVQYKELSLEVAVKILSKDSPRVWQQMLNNLELYITLKNQTQVTLYVNELQGIFNASDSVSDAMISRFETLQAQSEVVVK